MSFETCRLLTPPWISHERSEEFSKFGPKDDKVGNLSLGILLVTFIVLVQDLRYQKKRKTLFFGL